MTSYSHSRLGTFEKCKYQYKLQYIDKIKTDVNFIEAFMGGLVHETLEKLYKDLKFAKLNTIEELIKYYNELWNKEFTDDIIIVKKEYTAENYRQMGERYIILFYERYKPFDQTTVLGIETQDKMPLSDGNTYHIRIDRLACKDNVYYVCDYKTNSWMMDQESADSDRQLAMYSIWVKNKFPDAKKVVLMWHMLAFDKDVISERDDKQLKNLQKEIVEKIKEIESCSEFPTNITKLCDYCGYKTQCPSFKHEAELDGKTAKEFKDDDGVKLVNEFVEFNNKKKEIADKLENIKKDIIDFASQKKIDTVFGSNKKANIKEYSKIILPENKEMLVKLIKEKGIYEDVSMLNSIKLSGKILKGDIDKEIADMTTKEKAYKISISKRQEPPIE